MRLVAEAGRGDGALEAAFAAEADVLLLGDVTVSTPKTVDLIRDLQRRHPKLRVLVLGVHDEDRYAVRVLRAGAAGYLTTDLSPGQLVEAIRRVAGARRYLSPTLAQKLVFAEQVRGERTRHAGLSDREYEVLRLFGSGKSFKHIAAELGVSPTPGSSATRSRTISSNSTPSPRSPAASGRDDVTQRIPTGSVGLGPIPLGAPGRRAYAASGQPEAL